MRIRAFSKMLLTLAVVVMFFGLAGTASGVVVTPPTHWPAVSISSTDAWNSPTSVTGAGTCCGGVLSNLFDGTTAVTFFGPQGGAAGTVYTVDWQTTASKTIRSFHLNAWHDGNGNKFLGPLGGNASNRGISRFKLFAWNSSTSAFDIQLFDLELNLGIGSRPTPVYDPSTKLSLCECILDFLANVDQVVTTNKWRAEFTQFGFVAVSNSTPRITELDGLETFLTEPIPEPATLLLLGSGLLGLGLVRRRRAL